MERGESVELVTTGLGSVADPERIEAISDNGATPQHRFHVRR